MPANRITLLDLEREHILETLRRCLGNRTHTARSLGISVRGLRIKLATYAKTGTEVPPPASPHSWCTSEAVLRHATSATRTLKSPNLDAHVRRQLGLSLRIFYDGILSA